MNTNKKQAYKKLIDYPGDEREFYEFLKMTGDLKINYADYLITEPIDCNKELERLPEADYELCTALLTMLLREDHFCNGSFQKRYEQGHISSILSRMISLL